MMEGFPGSVICLILPEIRGGSIVILRSGAHVAYGSLLANASGNVKARWEATAAGSGARVCVNQVAIAFANRVFHGCPLWVAWRCRFVDARGRVPTPGDHEGPPFPTSSALAPPGTGATVYQAGGCMPKYWSRVYA
jgi:hypothetical protein